MEENRNPSESPERRAHQRFAVDAAATLVVVNQGAIFPGRVFDISLDGCGLHTGATQIFSGPVPVEVSFKINGIAFRLGGVMERADTVQTAGIRFSAMVPRRREVLVDVLAELEAEAARHPAAKLESSAGDAEAGTESLSAKLPSVSEPEPARADRSASTRTLTRPESKTTNRNAVLAAAVPPAPTPVTKAAQEPPENCKDAAPEPVRQAGREGSDRRTQRRHNVDTRATILFIDVGARAYGRIIDLSMSGCRIRTDERFPVGIYRRVEAEFHLDGLPFRLGGVIQSLHDRHTVGIRFLDMSDRKREQLGELISEIEAAAESAATDPVGQSPEAGPLPNPSL